MRSRILVCLSQVQPDLNGMNIDRTIIEIEYLERIFAVPDTRPLSTRLPIEGTTTCSLIARGFVFGSGMASLADLSPQCFD